MRWYNVSEAEKKVRGAAGEARAARRQMPRGDFRARSLRPRGAPCAVPWGNRTP